MPFPTTGPQRSHLWTFVAFSATVLATALVALFLVDFSIPPFEDAAMLMRYAGHLADGHGIVWNIGEPPVDGGTDFLFLVLLACFHRAGLSLELSNRILTIGAHFLTLSIIFWGMRRLQRASLLSCTLTATFFALGPGLFLSAAYFGTPVFTLVLAMTWLAAQRLMSQQQEPWTSHVAFSLSSLLLGLIRPEGVLASVLILLAIGLAVSPRVFFRSLLAYSLTMLCLGGLYLLWRYHYFGHFLPNPYYKKGGGNLYVAGLKTSVSNGFYLLYPFIPAFLLAALSKRTLRLSVAFATPILGFIGMWILLSDEMNFGGRFQYPVLVLGALSWYPLSQRAREMLFSRLRVFDARQALVLSLLVALSAPIIAQQLRRSKVITYSHDGRYDVAMILREYAERRLTIATTEAGLLPFYSRWRAVDTWGLNDPWIAGHGVITESYLESQKPDLIMWHGYFSPLHPIQRALTPWDQQVAVLQRYAEGHQFEVVAVFGNEPLDTHYYLIRRDLPDAKAISERIRSIPYRWFGGGLCKNWLLADASTANAADARRYKQPEEQLSAPAVSW
jgi:hypothetical protein